MTAQGVYIPMGTTVCKTVRPTLSDRCLSCPLCPFCPDCPVCYVGVLWPNGWMDQYEIWHAGGSRSRTHCARWGPSSSPQKRGHSPPIFGPCLLWPNGCMYQDTTWYGGRPQLTRNCVRRGPSSPSPKGAQPPPQIFGQFALWPNGWMD